MVANPPFFTTLAAGLLIAFALQLLLTNLGIAAGITALGYLPRSDSDDSDSSEPEKSEASGNSGRTIGFAVGFGALLTVNTVLFAACFLAVKLSMAGSAVVGATFGVVIWSAYFLVLIWLASTAVGSLLGSALGVLNTGWQGLRTIARMALGRQTSSTDTSLQEQIAAIAEAQRQLTEIRVNQIQERVDRYLESLPLADSVQIEARSLPDTNDDLIQWIRAAKPNELTSDELNRRLKQRTETEPYSQESSTTAMWMPYLKMLFRVARDRIDLSELDVAHILSQLQSSQNQLGHVVKQVSNWFSPINTIQQDVEDYLLNAPSQRLTRKTVKDEFRDVIYDVEADPQLIQAQLAQLERDQLIEILSQRDDLSPKAVEKVVDRLMSVRAAVLQELEARIELEQLEQPIADSSTDEYSEEVQTQAKAAAQALWQQMLNYVSESEEKLNARNIQRQLKRLLKSSTIEPEVLQRYLPSFQPDKLLQALQKQPDLSEKQINQISARVEKAWSKLLEKTTSNLPPVEERYQQLQGTIVEYLQTLNPSELNLETVSEDLLKLLKQPQIATSGLAPLLMQIDWQQLADVLQKSGHFTEQQIRQIVDQVQRLMFSLSRFPRRWAVRAQKLSQRVSAQLEGDANNSASGWKTASQNGLGLVKESVKQGLDELSYSTRSVALKVRDDLSTSIATQVNDRVESIRASLTEQIEQIQQETDRQITALKQQAQQQAETARKVTAIAAWWLFSTALTSLLSSAIAGTLAVTGFDFPLIK